MFLYILYLVQIGHKQQELYMKADVICLRNSKSPLSLRGANWKFRTTRNL